MMVRNRLLALSLVLSSLTVTSSMYLGCPNAEFIYPCSCRRIMSLLHILCNRVHGESTLSLPFEYLKFYSIGKLLLTHADFQMHNDVFENLTMNTLKITNSQYKVIGRGATFKGLENQLLFVEFRRCSAIDFGDTTLGPMKNLHEITVAHSTIANLRRKWFDNLKTEFTLTIENSEIKSIEDGVLAGVSALEQVIWSGNGLQTVKRNYFPNPANHLQALDLSYNSIEVLPDDMFTGMPKLKTIQLYGNKIKELKENVWTPIWRSITTVGLEDNQIKCDGSLIWMFERAFPPRFNAHCETPQELHDSLIRGLQKSDIEKYLK